ncbi:hypothetical protein WICPIJ_008203 [Wickerhamomyces pijperi]|uniref:N-acetyltransferase domain-containing protein n=1 Tax=Wickerhamomyces pijperi TaxID=599730 RepID=A0A9P8TJ03_WICPI|nr:hypothetical protein WICPIJ_008203 [Wickerhamomyces pijperi]
MTEYRADQHFQALLSNYTVLLKDGETTATIYPIYNSSQLPPGLLAFLADEFNVEVERGDSFPFFDALDFEEFKNYWFGSFAAVMVLGDDQQLDHQRQWEKECLGTFFMRSNFPGRSSHICSGAFLVNAGIRGKGIGRTLTECYLDWAPKLGYTSAVFNLVYESNVGARRIFEVLNFKRIGKIKAAGILKDHNQAVDALIYGKELVSSVEQPQGTYRFDKIRFYLETGKYPPSLDRQEKSRLRSSAAHYKLENGRLYLKGKEVIGDAVQQMEICTEYHRVGHGGINKTTSAITEKYHWSKIKDTVAQAIRNCPQCRTISKYSTKKQKVPKESGNDSGKPTDAQAVMNPTNNDNSDDENDSIEDIGGNTVNDETLDIAMHSTRLVHGSSSGSSSNNRDNTNNSGSGSSGSSGNRSRNNMINSRGPLPTSDSLVRSSSHFDRDHDVIYTGLEGNIELGEDMTKYQRYQSIDHPQNKQHLPHAVLERAHIRRELGAGVNDNGEEDQDDDDAAEDEEEEDDDDDDDVNHDNENGSDPKHHLQKIGEQTHEILQQHLGMRKRSYNDIVSSSLYAVDDSRPHHEDQEEIEHLLQNRNKIPHIDLPEDDIDNIHHDSSKNRVAADLQAQIIHGYDTTRYYDDAGGRSDEADMLDHRVPVFNESNPHMQNHSRSEEDMPAEIEIARALIQANEEGGHRDEGDEDDDDETDYFKSH